MPVVALLGSRQVGKTTLAKALDIGKARHYLDLERPSDLAKLADPELYLSGFADQLVIIDEVQRAPELFPVLRSLVDQRRRAGEKAGHFLLLGSASPELLHQSSETLAGRISYLELPALNLMELEHSSKEQNRHWERGGYPDSYLAPKVTPGLTESMNTLGAQRGVIIIPEGESYPLSKTVAASGLLSFL